MNNNPYGCLSDFISPRLKVLWKSKIAPLVGRAYYHEIIPETPNHYAWYLGAQPTEAIINELLISQKAKGAHLISMLTEQEKLIHDNSQSVIDGRIIFHLCPWYDHSYLNVMTGKNQKISEWVDFQCNLSKYFFKNNTVFPVRDDRRIFYCHCMAGRSRSFIETLAFIYFYSNKYELFDFAYWPQKKLLKSDLMGRLENYPSCSDLGKFIKGERSQVKMLIAMDGDQIGILGLMVLYKYASEEGAKIISNRDFCRLLNDAKEIGFILRAPLDCGFRDLNDGLDQRDQLVTVYQRFYARGVNLLFAMIADWDCNLDRRKFSDRFERRFRRLTPSAQIRFAILMKGLEDHGCDLFPFTYSSAHYAAMAIEKPEKLTTGDRIELLKTFEGYYDYTGIVNGILNGNKIDRYNSKLKLAELTSLLLHRK